MFWTDEKILELVVTHCKCTKCHSVVHFKMINCMLYDFHLIKRKKCIGLSNDIYIHKKNEAIMY